MLKVKRKTVITPVTGRNQSDIWILTIMCFIILTNSNKGESKRLCILNRNCLEFINSVQPVHSVVFFLKGSANISARLSPLTTNSLFLIWLTTVPFILVQQCWNQLADIQLAGIINLSECTLDYPFCFFQSLLWLNRRTVIIVNSTWCIQRHSAILKFKVCWTETARAELPDQYCNCVKKCDHTKPCHKCILFLHQENQTKMYFVFINISLLSWW